MRSCVHCVHQDRRGPAFQSLSAQLKIMRLASFDTASFCICNNCNNSPVGTMACHPDHVPTSTRRINIASKVGAQGKKTHYVEETWEHVEGVGGGGLSQKV